jgi:hypothetical protein
MVKDKDCQILIDENAIQAGWKSNFNDLLNFLNTSNPLEHNDLVKGAENEISRNEIAMAIKQMKNNEAPGLSGIIGLVEML